jgi:multiple sugar transport system permease protein
MSERETNSSAIHKNRDHMKIVLHIILIIGVLLTVLPFIWMVLTSFKSLGESMQIPPKILPQSFSFTNYATALSILPFGAFYFNTAFSTLVVVIGQVILCSMAAYAFARISFPGKNVIFLILLSVLMVPSQIFLLPQYLYMQNLGLLNTVTALWLPNIFSAFGTFLLRQFFLTLPVELEEAATLDGCNHFQIYYKIMLPLAKPGVVSLAIFTGLNSWNSLMWPLIVNTSTEKMTLSVGLSSLQGQHGTNFPVLMAGSVMAIWPMIVVFMIFQKQFVQGIAFTGTKA